MEDFIELGLEAMDNSVDKGFHKVPDRLLQNPFRRKKQRDAAAVAAGLPPSPPLPVDDQDRDRDLGRTSTRESGRSERRSGGGRDRDRGISPVEYESRRERRRDRERDRDRGDRDRDRDGDRDTYYDDNEDSRPRTGQDRAAPAGEYGYSPYYTPQTGLLTYRSPPPGASATMAGGVESSSGYSEDERARAPRSDRNDPYASYRSSFIYPAPPPGWENGGYDDSRRARSQVPPLERDGDRDRGRASSAGRRGGRRGSSAGSESDKGREVKDKLKKTFSNSERGLGAGIMGALAGGLIAQEAGLRSGGGGGKRGKKGKEGRAKGFVKDPMVLTLLGAVVGGLGANLAEKKFGEREMEKSRERARSRSRSVGRRAKSGDRSGGGRRRRDSVSSEEDYEDERFGKRNSGPYNDQFERRKRRGSGRY